MKIFTNGNYTFICWAENTRYGFRHLCEVHHDGCAIGRAKACYYNRTLEQYEFESVLTCAVGKFKLPLALDAFRAA